MTEHERFWNKVFIDDENPNGCWRWDAWLNNNGYGTFSVGPPWKSVYAHRWAYEHEVGPIPKGLDLDHLCQNPRCVNPTHLEPVTHRENMLRGRTNVAALNAAKTHCKHGHEFTPENTYHRPDMAISRGCRACKRERDRQYHARRRSA